MWKMKFLPASPDEIFADAFAHQPGEGPRKYVFAETDENPCPRLLKHQPRSASTSLVCCKELASNGTDQLG
jgi:hypothetical protein